MTDKPLLDVGDAQWAIIQDILHKHIPDREVWAFGSRARWTAKEFSDLDLAVIGQEPMSLDVAAALADDFSESDLPWKVDVVDWATTSEGFRTIIERDKVVVQKSSKERGSWGRGSEWPQIKLGSLVEIKHGFAFKGEFFSEVATPFQLTTPGNFAIGGGFQTGKGKFYNGPVPEDYVLKAGDLLVTMTDLSKAGDTLGYAAVVPQTRGVTWLHNQRVGLVTTKPDASVSKGFLHYLMRSPEYRNWVVSTATGSTVKHTSPGRISDFEFPLPPIEHQHEVAVTLGALDDRITLLRETNTTLEAIAQALFKSWFVDFDPVHAKMQGRAPEGIDQATAALFPDSFEDSEQGPVPKGWNVASIYEVAKVIYGAPFASKQFKSAPPGKPLVRIRDLKDERPGVYTEEIHPKGYLLQPGDITVGMDGEFRAYVWGGEEAWLNQRVCVFEPVNGANSVFVRLSIAPLLAAVEASETATTVIHLGKNDIDRFKVCHPGELVLDAFASLTTPVYQRIVGNKQMIQNLAGLRDTLLPRLISGQLRVSEALESIQ